MTHFCITPLPYDKSISMRSDNIQEAVQNITVDNRGSSEKVAVSVTTATFDPQIEDRHSLLILVKQIIHLHISRLTFGFMLEMMYSFSYL